MSIIRIKKRENPFVQLDSRPLADERLSWKAKGILAYLLSKPDQWQVVVTELIKRSRDGRDAVYKGLEELKAAGYAQKVRIRAADGAFVRHDYVVREEPLTENPEVDAPYMVEAAGMKMTSTTSGFSISGKPATSNNDLSKNENALSTKAFRSRTTKGQLLALEAERQMGNVWREIAGREERGAGGLRRVLS